MGLNYIHRLGILKKPLLWAWRWDARNKYKRFESLLEPGMTLLDIGSGYGTVTELLRGKGFETVALDVQDQSIRPDLKPQIVEDSSSLSFAENAYDVALLLTVLHHTHEPVDILKETARVAKTVIVIEDVYRNRVQQYLTYFFDSLFNLEFSGHPHSNKTRDAWQTACEREELQFRLIRSDRFLLFFRQETYQITAKTDVVLNAEMT